MDFIKLNQKLQIVFEENSIIYPCSSQIIDYDKSAILLYEPIYKSNPIQISIGTVLDVIVIDSNCIYSFSSSVIGKQKSPSSVWINIPESYKRIQRREYARVNLKIPVLVSLECNTEVLEESLSSNLFAEDTYKDRYFETVSIDLSGGGIKIFSPFMFKQDTTLNLNIRLPVREILTSVKVIRSESNNKISNLELSAKEYAKYNYVTALKYNKINDLDRAAIIHLCFKRQLEMTQRGIL